MDIKHHLDRMHRDWEVVKNGIKHKHTGVVYDTETFAFETRDCHRTLTAERACQLHEQAMAAVAACEETWRESLERALANQGFLPLTHHKSIQDDQYLVNAQGNSGVIVFMLRCFEDKKFRFESRDGMPKLPDVSKLLGLAERLKSMGWAEVLP